ncbi:MAG TPA: tetratricopeptide repeat protein, partial [Pyrinomonadaceae bacterium]|nr:tetratricopeptide repeat protein [Pyrinomonadaceae bacterium]
MKKQTLTKRDRSLAAKASSFAAAADVHHSRLRSISDDELDEIFVLIGGELRNGRSSKAEEILTDALESRTLSPDAFANLKRLLSFTLETLGRYKESLAVVKPFEDEENLGQLTVETQVRVTTQLAIAYSNLSDQPKAVTLLKENLSKAQENELTHLSGNIDNALARVYRKLNECPIARDYAEKSLNYFRSNGDWIGMAEAYREIALSHHQEGSSKRSLEYFDLGIKIIGSHAAPFMLGKLYTDMSGAYWFLRRPHDGIACLEKSIEFFDQTEHVLNSIIAYNNLGINLMLIGEWQKADDVINRA